MSFRISGKNLDIGDALRERVNARIAEVLAKYFDGGYSGHVTVARDGFGFRTECAIHLDSGITLHTEANAADAYASADQAALLIEKRMRRYKRRLKDRHTARVNLPNVLATDRLLTNRSFSLLKVLSRHLISLIISRSRRPALIIGA